MEVTLFEYPGCPYCRQARKILQKLTLEHPEYAAVHFTRVDEVRQRELAAQYDYEKTPSFFLGGRKLYEADPAWSAQEAEARLRRMLDDLLREQAAQPARP